MKKQKFTPLLTQEEFALINVIMAITMAIIFAYIVLEVAG